jgi:GNAT superfamily N-acetyltransferase
MPADIEVVELSPELVDDYFQLFDHAFRDNPLWNGCYCWYHDDVSGQPWRPVEDGAEHRRLRAEKVRSGTARGLLAYSAGVPVGWCNVAPRSEYANLRFAIKAVQESDADPAVIMCFVIDPDHRGQGVASALLRAALDVSRRWGVPWLEGYPADPKAFDDDLPKTAQAYTGPLAMYEAAGFEVARDLGDWKVVRHRLVT